MGIAGVTGRLGRLEARVDEAVLTFMARSMAAVSTASIDEYRSELRALFRELALLGPNAGPRVRARVIARRYGADEERVYRQLLVGKKKRGRK
jgi:hypothetical protein